VGPVAASARPPPTGTRRALSWRAPLRRRRFRVADRVCWRWGRRPRGDGRRSNNPQDGGGTGGSRRGLGEATSNGHPQSSLLEGAAPSTPVPCGGPCLLEVGSPTPRRWAPLEQSAGRRRDRWVPSRPRRGHLQRAPEGFSPGGRRSVGAGSVWRTVSVGGGVADPAEMGAARTIRRTEAGPVGPVAASARPPPTGTRRVLSWRAPLRRRRFRVADRVCWRWGRRPRGDGRRSNNPQDGGGTGGSRRGLGEATSNGHPQSSLLEGAAPSTPVPCGGPCLLEVGSPTPRRWAPLEQSAGRRRDRWVPPRPRRGHLQRAPAELSPGGRRSVDAGSVWRTVSVGGGVADPAEMGAARTIRRTEAGPVGPVAASARPPPTGTRRALSWRAPLRRRRFRVADRVCWRWGRRPRGDGRRSNNPQDGGGTGGSRRGLGEATSNGHPKGSLLEGASPSAPVARRRRCPL
jgi:hypothetical protein